MNYPQMYTDFFEELSENTPQEEYEKFFDKDSYFEDPFQKVIGADKIYHIFDDMYGKFHNPKFEILECISSENVSYIKWNFLYQMNSNAKVISFVGISRVVFSKSGKVVEHIDYWDSGANVYEKIPLLGAVIRFVKRKIHA